MNDRKTSALFLGHTLQKRTLMLYATRARREIVYERFAFICS